MGKRLHAAYIQSHALSPQIQTAFFDCVMDLLERPEVQGLAQYEQHFDIDRLQHITSVAYISFLVSRKLGCDFRLAARGAMLHDLFYYDWREKDASHKWHGYYHPGFAVKNAKVLLGGELEPKMENIIRRHMWPLTLTPPRYRESMIVSMADKYCSSWEILISFHKKSREKFLRALQEYEAKMQAQRDIDTACNYK